MNYVRFAQDAVQTAGIGGKARALAELRRADLPIPDWFVVTGEGFYASITPQQRRELESAENPEDVQRLVGNAACGTELTRELRRSLYGLCPDGGMVAVRSSAADEDSPEHSFAGQFDSFLFVPPEDVPDKVAAVWRSGFSDRILAYRKQNGLPLAPNPPSVLVQRMIDSEMSGVAFGADPVSGRRSIAVVGAIYGLGTALVSGDCDADTFQVDLRDNILSREIVDKPIRHVMDISGQEGVKRVDVEESKRRQPAVSDEQVLEIARLVRATSRHFGKPQDIEWAIAGGKLHLLQSRPITTLYNMADPDGTLNIWDNHNIAESYAGVTTPLTFSFARSAYEAVYREFCRIMKVSERRMSSNDQTFENMLGLIRGRLYYNLLNWYRVLALLPGFKANRKFMEQMMGVEEELPQDIVDRLALARWSDRFADSFNLAQSVLGLISNFFRLKRKIDRFYERLDEALAEVSPPLEEMRAEELVAYYKDLEMKLLNKWDAPLINDFFAMIFFGVLRKLVAKWCGDRDGTLQNNLLTSQGGMISAEPAQRVHKMAAIASTDPKLVDILSESSLEDILSALESSKELKAEYESYLEKFGDRCMGELKLESSTLYDDPMILFRSVGEYARKLRSEATPGMKPDDKREDGALRKADLQVRKALAWKPLRRSIFAWVLRNTRDRLRDRENLRFERTRVFGRVRRIFVEIGSRFHSLDLLEHPRDIFYLEVEQVFGFINGTADTTDLKGLVTLRKDEFSRYLSEPAPPERFETRGIVYQGNDFRGRESEIDTGGADVDERKGIGCCPGLVRGEVRVIRDPAHADLRHGHILVAERTDPGWIMIFPSAAGLLVERGSLLSHAAIVSREMGIPSIVSISGLTRWLKDGDQVEMDGTSGIVRKILSPSGTDRNTAHA